MYQLDNSCLEEYPILRSLVSTDSPNALFLTGNLEQRYTVIMEGGERRRLSLLDLCCLFGKTAHLTALWPSDVSVLGSQWHQSAILQAAVNGQIETIKYLERYLTDAELREAVKWDTGLNYIIIRHAARNGQTATIQYLERYLTNKERKEAVKAYNYIAIQNAASNGHTATLQHLESHLNDDERKQAFKADNYLAIRYAAYKGHTATIHHFLQTDIALAYMEGHDREYGAEYVYPYVTERLNTLSTTKTHYEQANPQGVFDVSNEEARQGFYLLRNLIRRGVARDDRPAEDHADSMRLLLSIPGIRALCAQDLNPDSGGQENELLRLALRLGNQTAAGMLMQIPEVRRLAVQNNHYRAETLGDLDLAAVSRNNESSMVALSLPERQALAAVEQHYQQAIHTRGGSEAVFAELVGALKSRYIEHPASFKRMCLDGTVRKRRLPLAWSDFQALITKGLSPTEQQLALKAYYQHPVHTAFRYLSKPNHWMAANAGYVNRYANEAGEQTDFHYSTFEEYRPHISLLYTAAFDEQTAAIDGYTLAGRQELFIRELALIGRAHNWDGYRTNPNTNKTEQFDDLQGDKPSCFSGVNRRLFQSVLGHPLLKQLNPNLVKQCVNEHVREWFKTKITPENVHAINAANQAVIAYEDDDETAITTLATLNISPEEQDKIIALTSNQLAHEFPQSFAANALLWRECLKDHLTNTAKTAKAHFIAFDGVARLSSLVDDILQQAPSSASKHGLFAGNTTTAPVSESTPKPDNTPK